MTVTAEIPQSLAKWKRMMLGDYGIPVGYGLYMDMNAIRPDEEPDNLHSYYVDQWDWEKSISHSDRNLEYLKSVVKKIYSTLKATEFMVYECYPEIEPILPGGHAQAAGNPECPGTEGSPVPQAASGRRVPGIDRGGDRPIKTLYVPAPESPCG